MPRYACVKNHMWLLPCMLNPTCHPPHVPTTRKAEGLVLGRHGQLLGKFVHLQGVDAIGRWQDDTHGIGVHIYVYISVHMNANKKINIYI